MRLIRTIPGVLLVGAISTGAWATAPTLFSQPGYESPVRGDPDDRLVLAGSGFAATDTVVYQSAGDTTSPPVTPTSVPSTSTATSGVAPVVSQLNVPDSLTGGLLYAGLIAEQSKQLNESQRDFETALKLDPNNTELQWRLHRNLARIELGAGDAPGAAREYAAALELAPAEPQLVMDAARLYEQQGSIDAAGPDCLGRAQVARLSGRPARLRIM